MKRSSRAGRLTQLERNQRTTGIFFILPSLVLCAIFMVVPLINVIRYSLTDWDGLSKTYNFVGLYNYMHLHEIEGFGEMMLATVTFAIGVTAITIIVSFLAALALDKRGRDRLPRGLMRALWFFPALLSGAVVGILWRIMYNYNNGVINKIITSAGLPAVNWLETRGVTNIAIIIGAAWVQIGLCVVVFLAGLQSIPQEMYEAASIDGATPSQQLKNITIPMMASSITINVITTTIAAFKAYELPYLISKGLPGHSTLLITQRIFFFGFQAFDYGRGSALSVVLLLSRVHVPGVLADTISSVSGVTIPLSMLVIGTSLGGISVRSVLTDWRVYVVSAVRLLVCPLLTWLVLRPLSVGHARHGAVPAVRPVGCVRVQVHFPQHDPVRRDDPAADLAAVVTGAGIV